MWWDCLWQSNTAFTCTNEFGWLLLNYLAKNQGNDIDNLFFSPFSLWVSLAMTRLGAKGETADGMERALCWKGEGSVIHEDFQKFIRLLKTPTDSCILQIANRIYIDEGYNCLEDFLKQVMKLYMAEPVPAQFNSNHEEERVNINKWVEEQTENEIKDLIQPGVLDPHTRMDLEQKLTTEQIGDIMSDLQTTEVKVSLPKFEICSSFKLKEALSQLGMSKAFDLQEADFSGMTGIRDLVISEVVHKAFLKVNEDGSEAAASTAAVIMPQCAMVRIVPEFNANHPFLVVVRHNPSDVILFMGNVNNPPGTPVSVDSNTFSFSLLLYLLFLLCSWIIYKFINFS